MRRAGFYGKVLALMGIWCMTSSLASLEPQGTAKEPAGKPEAMVSIKGAVRDTAFRNAGDLVVEVLESGDSVRTGYRDSFTIGLPRDTLWNLCVRGDSLERCYEVTYTGNDSVFEASLGEDYLVWESRSDSAQADTAPEPQKDTVSLVEEEAESTFGEEENVTLKKVILRVRRVPKRTLGKATVSAKTIKRMPGLAEADVIRSIQALPGVVASSDFSTKIYVRGGAADQNLFLLDNGVVFSPVHFFGLFSTFLVEGIDEVQFYKGGFDPEYGNRLASVVDIKTRRGGKPDTNEWFSKSSAKISTFATQVHTEGRQGPVNWIHAGRATYIKEILKALRSGGLTDLDLDYRFYDFQGTVSYEPTDDQELYFTYYLGQDKLDFSPFIVDWGNMVFPLNHRWQMSEDWMSLATFSYSKFEQSFGLENIFAFLNDIDVWNYNHLWEYSGLKGHRLRFGSQVKKYGITFEQEWGGEHFEDPTDFWLTSGYLQDVWEPGPFQFRVGARVNYSSTVEDFGWEPRFSASYEFGNHNSLDFHAGYYMQYINSIVFGDQETLNEFYYPAKNLTLHNVKPTNSILFSAGYGKQRLWDKWDFSIEAYYKTLNNLLIFAQDEAPDSADNLPHLKLGDFFKDGEGYSFGLELSTRLDFGTIWGSTSYSFGQAIIREENDTLAYFANWHQPHSLKGDMAVNWKGEDGIWSHKKRGRYFRSSMQVKFTSGLPYTEVLGYVPPHLLDQSQGGVSAGGPNPEFQGNFNTIQGNRNTGSLPTYFRWDIKPIDIGREGRWSFAWTLVNITNHENIFLYFYDNFQNPPVREEIPQFPFFPLLLNFELSF